MAEETTKDTQAAAAPSAAAAKAKKKATKAPAHGVVHINCSFNNTIVTVTDDKGSTITWSTAGSHGFKGTKKGTPFAAQITCSKVGEKAASMVVAKSIDIAGDEITDCIMQYFRKKYNLIIGETTAEDVKINIGSVYPLEEEKAMEVKGRDQTQGLPRTMTVTSEEIRQALLEPARAIVELVKSTLEETPPELAADLVDRGLVVAGGGSLLRGMTELIKKETDIPVHRAADPLSCVALGTGKYLEFLAEGKFKKFL